MTNNNLSTVRAIGKGARYLETAVPMIVATAPEGFDPSKRGAVSDLVHAWAGFPDKDNRPAMKTGGKDNATITDYGRGVESLVSAVKRAMAGDKPETTPDYLALVLQAAETAHGKGSVEVTRIAAAISEWAAKHA